MCPYSRVATRAFTRTALFGEVTLSSKRCSKVKADDILWIIWASKWGVVFHGRLAEYSCASKPRYYRRKLMGRVSPLGQRR